MRTDIPLIKHMIDQIGPEAGGVYNRLPLLVMPDDSDLLLGHERDLLETALPSLEPGRKSPANRK
jgi:hypothetical protein